MDLSLGLDLGAAARATGGGFNPASLFAGGEQGVFWNVTPATTGTTNGNPVSTMTDSSGRGNNATGSGANRPTLNESGGLFALSFDGTDDSLSTSAFNMTTNEMTIIVGLRKASDSALGMALEFSPNINTNAGSFYVAAPESIGASGNFTFQAAGTSVGPSLASGTILAPATRVLTATAKISTPSRILRINGVQVASSANGVGTGNFGNYALFMGRRNNASLPFNGLIYGVILINRILTASEIAQAEQWMATKSGVVI